jgi:predicted enzyme related to lactoylglutathione lyase
MGTRESYANGTFCWVDLATTDTEAAKAFYGALFGWSLQEVPQYGFFRRGDAVVAGLAELQPAQRDAGVPPSWSSYVRVEEADAVCARAEQLGGAVRAAPFEIPQAGRMAVLADPQGAVFLLREPGKFPGAELVNTPGSFTWNDLQTTDPEAAAGFYRDLFGWEIAATEGAGGAYFTIRNRGRMNGGLMRSPQEGVPPFWMAYFGVESLDGAMEQTRQAGGAVLAGPIEVPAGRFAALRDPQGAVFSVMEGEYDD